MMKTILNESTRQEVIDRINNLSHNSNRNWGKMTLFQMLKHCTTWDDWVQGNTTIPYKQSLFGMVFGKMALKETVNNDRPLKKNMPAGDLRVFETHGDIEQQKANWIERISRYHNYSNPDFVHDFFGRMTEGEIGILAYKHADHHLRQFGC